MTAGRKFGVVATLLIIAGAAFAGWRYWKGRQDREPDFYTATVTQGDLTQTVTATGVIKPVLDILVSSQISGYVNKIYADFNDKVQAGQLLCTLLPDAYQSAVDSADGDLENSEANYQLQKVSLNRDKNLLDQKLLAQSDYDTQAALLGEAAAVVKIKRAALATAQTNLKYCRITAPIDGVVISRNVVEGNSVAVSLSAPTLFEIGNDLTKMQIDASVAEADIGNVADGQMVNFTVDAYQNRQFQGVVYQVRDAPQIVQSVVTYDVMINVNNGDLALKPGMTANVSIIAARRAHALCLANSAIRFRMPEDRAVTPPPPLPVEKTAIPGAPPVRTKRLTPAQNRQKVREIMLAVGYSYTPGGELPAPDVVERMKKMAAERGVQLPDRIVNSGRRVAGSAEAPVMRIVYRLPGGNLFAKPEAVRVKLGITDGTDTEVMDGLSPGDVVITGLTQLIVPHSPGANPFGGSSSRGF